MSLWKALFDVDDDGDLTMWDNPNCELRLWSQGSFKAWQHWCCWCWSTHLNIISILFLVLLFNITIIIWMKLREWKFWSPAPKSTCPMASQTSNSEMLNVAGSSQSTWRRFKGELENANFCFWKGWEFQLQWWVSWSPKDVVKTPRPWVEELSSFVEPGSLRPIGWLAFLLGFQDR